MSHLQNTIFILRNSLLLSPGNNGKKYFRYPYEKLKKISVNNPYIGQSRQELIYVREVEGYGLVIMTQSDSDSAIVCLVDL